MIKGRFYVWARASIGFVGGLSALALTAGNDHAALMAIVITVIAESVVWLVALEAV